jgi:hypothetical protein
MTDANKIEITASIAKKLESFSDCQRSEILRRAWDACNDGAWLKSEYGDFNFDPWDGEHEVERTDIEEAAVDAVLELDL